MHRQPIDPRVFATISTTRFPLRVTLQGAVESRDAKGGVVTTWGTVAGMQGIAAVVVPRSQSEQRGAQFVSAESTHGFMLTGYYPQVTQAMQVLADDGLSYDITGFSFDPWHTFTQLEAKIRR